MTITASQKLQIVFSTYLDQTEESFEHSFFDQGNYGRWKEDIEENYFSKAADGYLISKEFQKFLSICLEKMPSKLKAVFCVKIY